MEDQDYSYLAVFDDLVKGMVSNENSSLVEMSRDDKGILLTIDVAVEDRGKVIGKGGKTVDALRTIAHVIGSKHGSRISVVIKD